MSPTIAATVNWVEAVGNLHFPSKADRRLQETRRVLPGAMAYYRSLFPLRFAALHSKS
jgi:hypothetical protein